MQVLRGMQGERQGYNADTIQSGGISEEYKRERQGYNADTIFD
jgi:hypothetical protein